MERTLFISCEEKLVIMICSYIGRPLNIFHPYFRVLEIKYFDKSLLNKVV
jgi:hypothetical protein